MSAATSFALSDYNTAVDVQDRHFIFNGMSGELIQMSNGDRQQLDEVLAGERSAADIGQLLEQLIKANIVIPSDLDELSVLRRRYHQSRMGGGTLGLTLVASLGCNFDCPYCYEDKTPSLLGDGVAESVLRLVDDSMPTMNALDVTWFGGEPLLAKKELLKLSDKFIERCDANDVVYMASIITNGWHLTPETAAQLADRRVTFTQVTLDGPPATHEKYRPTVSGRPSFYRIIENLQSAVELLDVHVRMNVDAGNLGGAEELLSILADEGLAGRLTVYPALIVNNTDVSGSPAAQYGGRCFSKSEFSKVELEFQALAYQYGFKRKPLPGPIATPCMAVRTTDIVVGADGELWKCWEAVGDQSKVFGHIDNYSVSNSELDKWLTYDPFKDDECVQCPALPVCMGGCAHHSLTGDREGRCRTFRHNRFQQVQNLAHSELGLPPLYSDETPMIDLAKAGEFESTTATAVTLTRKPSQTPQLATSA